MEDEPYRLTSPPATRSARHAARIRAERDQAEAVARRDPGFKAFRARAFLVCHGPDLAWAFDPAEDHSTLATVLEDLTARVQAARHGKNPPARWWDRDLAVWQAGRFARHHPPRGGGMPVVTVFDESGRGGS